MEKIARSKLNNKPKHSKRTETRRADHPLSIPYTRRTRQLDLKKRAPITRTLGNQSPRPERFSTHQNRIKGNMQEIPVVPIIDRTWHRPATRRSHPEFFKYCRTKQAWPCRLCDKRAASIHINSEGQKKYTAWYDNGGKSEWTGHTSEEDYQTESKTPRSSPWLFTGNLSSLAPPMQPVHPTPHGRAST